MRRTVARLKARHTRASDWQGYADDNSYEASERKAKRRFVAEFVESAAPDILWDIGCNTGDYSVAALEAGARRVVGFDFDHNAVDAAFRRAASDGLDFLPLVMDAANPSPGQGWAQGERQGISQRSTADALLALALVHHLAIGNNVPLHDVLDWLVGMAPQGVIEFVPKSDPMVQRLLRLREDIFDDYDRQSFETGLRCHARIVRSQQVSQTGRHLYWYRRD